MRQWLWQLLTLGALVILSARAMGAEDNRDFRRNPSRQRGNERSERPTRFRSGELNYGGNGCPNGTMRVVFAPDLLSFTVIFDQFVAQTEVNTGNRRPARDRMNCTASVPIELPDRMQMEITRVDFRVFVSLPDPSSTGIIHSLFSFQSQGPRERDRLHLRYRFSGPTMKNYFISTEAMTNSGRAQSSQVSPCGGSTQLRFVNDLQVISRNPGSAATLTLDSIDGSSQAIYYVNWRSC